MSDVMSNVWYTGAVNWAFKNGIITGYKDGDGNVTGFGPDDPVTREQVCVILMNYAKTQNAADIAGQTDAGKLTSMPDGSQVSTWAQEGVAWALTRGVIGGVEHADGTKTIEPLRSIYRCEMGAIMRNCTSNNDIIVPPTVKMQIPSSEDAANTAGSAEFILRTAESEGAATANGAEAAASAQTPASVSATEAPATETTTKED